MVSNHFGAKVVTQCRGALPTFPRLDVVNYLSLISWSFGGFVQGCRVTIAAVVAVAAGIRKDGDQRDARRRLPVAPAGDACV